ncbi:MAG: DUF6568 family protein [Bacilli bacterium]
MKEELRVIPKKNYIILGIVILVSLLIIYYFYMWVSAYKDAKENVSVLDNYMNVINYNELDNYIVENPDSIIYVSVVDDIEINKFDKKLANSIKNNDFNKDVLYMNITETIKDTSIKREMIEKYSLKYADITDVPNIIVFEDGKLISIYNIKDNGYSVSKAVEFVNNIKFGDGEIK